MYVYMSINMYVYIHIQVYVYICAYTLHNWSSLKLKLFIFLSFFFLNDG